MVDRIKQLSSLARRTANTLKAVVPKKVRLSEREQLQAFDEDGRAGHPKLKGLIDGGHLRSAADWIRAMDRIKAKRAKRG